MTLGKEIEPDKDKLRIAQAVERYLISTRKKRAYLEEVLAPRTITDFFAGKFTAKTLTKIEQHLKRNFGATDKTDDAPAELGSYSYILVERLQGVYLAVRPLFGNPKVINAFIITMRWDAERPCLVFSESKRADQKYAREGAVYLENGKPFLNLLAIKAGEVRNYLITLPDDEGIARGLVLTTHNPNAFNFTPVAAPCCLRKLADDEAPATGLIEEGHASYSAYSELLAGVTSGGYGRLVTA
ncbi:hypothetical protein WHZ78_02400 [Bradyrhizobium symbiodeficiens]|uniref:hypothetical protein n=1 Tax=Bradyrhizobium symbiodeficiens TaxID=1404367 RepID=UPI0030CAC514